MTEKLAFYIRHSLNDLRVNGRRTFFALLCIAAGVAAIVSLQTVAVMMSDTLTGNLQETNRGDIRVALPAPDTSGSYSPPLVQAAEAGLLEEQPASSLFGMSGPPRYRIGARGIEALREWADANYPGEVEITYPWVIGDELAIFTGGTGSSLTVLESGAQAGQLIPVLIDPAVYPFYRQVTSIDGTPLADLFQSPTDIVVDRKAADALGASVGDLLRINGADTDFTLRGIVPTDAEVTDPTTGIFMALFGFYYLDHDALQFFDGVVPQTDTVYVKLSDPARTAEVSRALLTEFPYLQTTTPDMLREDNEGISERINQLVTVVGLVSMLLGSIGIVNTMQVIVRRRTVEVAVLKAMGLQGGEITALFLVEAFIMGLVGSLAGIVLGWVTTFVIRGVAESIMAQPLPFRIALMPAVNGLVVGTLITTIFGFLPTIAAGQVRPAVVLRPNDQVIPRAGRVRTLLALVLVILALSVVTSLILGSFTTALGVTVGAFVAAGVLVLLLSSLLWLVGRFFPSLGLIDLKISLRQMLAGRGRGATTLLALVVGVFSLSLITLMADAINSTLATALSTGSGGNVVIALLDPSAVPAVTEALDQTEGVNSYQVVRRYSGELMAVAYPDGTTLDRAALKERIAANSTYAEEMAMFGGNPADIDEGEVGLMALGDMTARDVADPLANPILSGRAFSADDAGLPVLVLTDSSHVHEAELEIGSRLTYTFGEGPAARDVTFELIGVTERPAVDGLTNASAYFPADALPDIAPGNTQIFAGVEPDSISALRRNLSAVRGATVLETAVFTRLITGLLGTFSAFPTMVALLGLIVGGVVIANSVALTTMERRREIAVMKAIGLQRERVLGMLLLEHALMGLIGGLIGVGLGLLILIGLVSATGSSALAIPFGTALLLMLLCVGVALVAALTSAWGASGEKPLNVLRYE